MTAPFIHLNLHSEYSLVDGLIRIKSLMKVVAAEAMPAIALTDQGNLFAMVRFYKAAMDAGIKPIIGSDIWLESATAGGPPGRLRLLCQDRRGFDSLSRIISLSYLQGQQRGVPQVRRAWLLENNAGLIALSGAQEGDVGQAIVAGRLDEAADRLKAWQQIFGDRYYLELQRIGQAGEIAWLQGAVDLASRYGVAVVATNAVRFLTAREYDAHEVRVCIGEGRTLDDPRRPRRYTDQQYLKSSAEMAELFADIPEALENTIGIAERCNLELQLGKYYLPDFPVPSGMTLDEFFRAESRTGLEARLRRILSPTADDFAGRAALYRQRLEIELDVIIGMGFPGYFLIVADFIRWAKRNAIPVGPGRGSGAGSLVAWALTITDIDPLPYDLLFERFLNPERVSMPDFDIDFCMEGRDRVIDYVAERYGRDRVSQIITFGSMAAKAVIRDVGRVLGHGYGFVDGIAKLVPMEVGISLRDAMEREPQLKERYQGEEEVTNLIDMALQLEGITRNAGKHAGGVVIAPTALTDFAPLYCEEGGTNVVTQFDKDDVEKVGLVKFDFLGLRTLTIIDWALQNIRRHTGAEIDINAIALDDRASFDLLKACQTTAVFQLESRGMKDLIRRLQPDCFEEIIALVALFRPGPLESGMVDDFINRKHGRAAVEYPFPETEIILKPTYGVIVYQEQVMQISQVIGGYTLGGADLLRRAMGKKKPEEMAKQRSTFMAGAAKGGFDAEKAGALFDLMEKFAGYGFNKSHSAAYALVSYQTMWLKAHYPAAFMAAVLSADMDNTDKVVNLIDEATTMGLKVVPPSVNTSLYKFGVRHDGAIIYGLGAIKGVGEAAIEAIVAERESGCTWRDLFDFCQRIDLKKCNRRSIEQLIRAGALDELGPHRAALLAHLEQAIRIANQQQRSQSAGMGDLFGFTSANDEHNEPQWQPIEAWDEAERLLGEKETLGLYLTGHPIEQYRREIQLFCRQRIADLKPARDRNILAAGMVVALRTTQNKRGERQAFATIDDRSGRIEVAMFAETYARYRSLVMLDQVLVVEGEVANDEYAGGLRLRAEAVFDMPTARQRFARSLDITLEEGVDLAVVEPLATLLLAARDQGQLRVRIHYRNQTASAILRLGDLWRVLPEDRLLKQLRRMPAIARVEIIYPT
jgi:DNA polymerase III subunit alpha